LVRIN